MSVSETVLASENTVCSWRRR